MYEHLKIHHRKACIYILIILLSIEYYLICVDLYCFSVHAVFVLMCILFFCPYSICVKTISGLCFMFNKLMFCSVLYNMCSIYM